MFCPKCGKQVEDESKFCPYCGQSLIDFSNQDNILAEEAEAAHYSEESKNSKLSAPKTNSNKLAIIIIAVLVAIAVIIAIVPTKKVTKIEYNVEIVEPSECLLENKSPYYTEVTFSSNFDGEYTVNYIFDENSIDVSQVVNINNGKATLLINPKIEGTFPITVNVSYVNQEGTSITSEKTFDVTYKIPRLIDPGLRIDEHSFTIERENDTTVEIYHSYLDSTSETDTQKRFVKAKSDNVNVKVEFLERTKPDRVTLKIKPIAGCNAKITVDLIDENKNILKTDYIDVEVPYVHHVCEKCNGSGSQQCADCYGGYVVCSGCGGDGIVYCSSCSGTGVYYHTYPVTNYSYVGGRRYSYTTYNGYYDICSTCSGNGKLRCSDCYGTGKERCFVCSGTGFTKCKTCRGKGEWDD